MSKLMCYSHSGFKNELEKNGWCDGNLPTDWVFISISESLTNSPESYPHLLKDCENVINLNFDDVNGYRVWDELPDVEWTPAMKELNKNVYGMNDNDADRLFEFIEKHIGKNIMVHCSAGLSRSQGVVRFILDCYPDLYTEKDTNPKNPCQIPNMYVVSMLKRRFYKKIGYVE